MEQLNLRLAEENDAEIILLLEQENQDCYFSDNVPYKGFSAGKNMERIHNKINHPSDTTGTYIVETHDKKIISSCSFYVTFHRNGYTFIRYNTLKEYRNSTLDIEALNLVIHLCFQDLNFNKLNVEIRSSQISTMELFVKCGFIAEVCSREHFFINGNYENIYHLGLVKQDYLNKNTVISDIEILDSTVPDIDYTLTPNVSPSKQILFGEKVDLTLITSEDVDKIYQSDIKSDEKNYASIAAAAPMSRSSILEKSQKQNDYCFLNNTISFAIRKKNGDIIGVIDADTISHRNRNLTIGLTIYDSSERGKGYGREAIELFTDFAFLEMNMHRVYLGCFAFNNKAVKLYERIGFRLEGTNRAFVYRNGNYYNENVLGVLKQEWLTLRGYL